MEKASISHRKPATSVIIKPRHPPPPPREDADGQRRPSALARSLSRTLSPGALLSLAKRRVARLLARCRRSSASHADDWVLLPLDDCYADDEFLKDGFIVYAPANTSAESLEGTLSQSHSGCASDENVENEPAPQGLSRSLSSGNIASVLAPSPTDENTAPPKYTKEQRLMARHAIGDLATISEACEVACDAFSRAWTTVEMSRIQRLQYINHNRHGRHLKPAQLLIGL
ncbi:hypothetical protein AURDEDRAFT_112269, partial [Auricularia subglabra TFB-10046 SS5]